MVIKLSFKKYFLYINTLKYLKGSQFYHRGFFLIKKKVLFKTAFWKKINQINNSKQIETIERVNPLKFTIDKLDNFAINIECIKKKKELLINKEFDFLNEKVIFKEELGWHDKSLAQLWRYNLHYFDYFRGLSENEVLEPNIENYEILRFYVKNWIINNKNVGLGDGWHPYTISLRLVNWIFAYSVFTKYLENDEEFNEEFLASIVTQSTFLLDNREYDVVGNHLFENLKTLIIIGMFFGESKLGEKYLIIGEKEMLKQLSEQFLEDGGHFELSAMYHSILLKGLTEMIYVYRNLEHEIPLEFSNVQKKALFYLENITHPDGEIPLFNDAAFGIANAPYYIVEFATEKKPKLSSLTFFDQLLVQNSSSPIEKMEIESNTFYAKHSGYLKSSDKKIFSIIDFGKPCPEYLPAHAHADIFSYEISFHGKRLVVDTGTYEYAGSKRNYDRSTRAHNTLTINEENQSEVWGSFRVANRAVPTVHSFKEDGDFTEILASHDGYNKKFGTLHYRKYIHVYNEAIIVLDFVNSKEKIESFIHFNPSTVFSYLDEDIVIINKDLVLKPINASFFVQDSVYHPMFGTEIENKKIVVRPNTPGVFGYYYYFGSSEILLNKEEIIFLKDNKVLSFDIRMGNQ